MCQVSASSQSSAVAPTCLTHVPFLSVIVYTLNFCILILNSLNGEEEINTLGQYAIFNKKLINNFDKIANFIMLAIKWPNYEHYYLN